MEVKATYRYARISPLKARDVAREVTGLPVSAALNVLNFTTKKAAFLIGKTLKSAIANAENNHDISSDNLIVKIAMVGDGPTFKRWKPRARGGAAPIRKRTSHIHVILTDEVTEAGKKPRINKSAKSEIVIEERDEAPVSKKRKAATKKKSAQKD
ncbi:MAG: large subunit ribosomal protein L22 [Verrucomicrobiales bacterium]|jgi:large subunit ribosomal protein L22